MRRVLALSIFVIPFVTLALEYTDVTERYSDAPFSKPEAAGISLLTNVRAVEGNPDGAFAPERELNRAEFLKIVIASRPSILVIPSDAANCFPDVRRDDWFSAYVCLSKIRGIIQGYPDGFFYPQHPVNYAEAIKMLVNVYGYSAPSPGPDEQWYVPFVAVAREHKVLLPTTKQYGAALTRGEMARLAAAFLAQSQGELALYRQAEQGKRIRSSSSSSSVSSIMSFSSSASSSLAPKSSAGSDVGFPAQSHQLLIGRMTPVLFDGIFVSPNEDAVLRSVRFEFERELQSIDDLLLIDSTGRTIGQLYLDTNNNADKKKWVGNFGTGTYLLPKGQSVLLGLRAALFNRANDGGSKEMFEITDQSGFSIFVEEKQSQETREIFPLPTHFPLSETAQARLEEMVNVLPERGIIAEGKNRQIGSFSFSGTTLQGAALQIDALSFHLETSGVTVGNWHIGGPAELEQEPCGVDTGDRTLIVCSEIPDDFKTFMNSESKPISLYGDIAIDAGATSPTVQVHFTDRGGIGENGDVWWSDGFGTYRWLEAMASLASGPRWEVIQ